MSQEVHVRFREHLRGRFPRVTRLVITGSSKELPENRIKPVVTTFLRERGLTLSEEKTAIVSISQGFDFLGFNIRKYGRKLLIKPAKSRIKSFLDVIRKEIKAGVALPTATLIGLLNRKITGWVSYYRHLVPKAVFSKIDAAIFWALYRMIRRKHSKNQLVGFTENITAAKGCATGSFTPSIARKTAKSGYHWR